MYATIRAHCFVFLIAALLCVATSANGRAATQAGVVCAAALDGPVAVAPAEGVAEFVSDVVMKCQGGTPTPPGQTIPRVTFRAYLNTDATGRLLSTSPDLSEALLLIDEPGPQHQLPCPALPCPIAGTGGGVGGDPNGPYNGAPGHYNVYQAAVVFENTLEWAEIPLDPPPPGQVRTLRITNVRVNVYAIANTIDLGGPEALEMFVSAVGSPDISITNPTQTVGFIRTGLIFTSTTAVLSSLLDHNTDQKGPAPSTDFTISFSEGFPGSFRTRTIASQPNDISASANQNVPGEVYPSASGFYNFSFSSTYASAGLATQGTRLVAHFENVPQVNLFVTEQPIAGTARVQLVSTGPKGDGPYDPIPATPGGFAPITVYNGSAVAVWEVVSPGGADLESLRFGVAVSYSVSDNGPPGLGTATVRGSLGPLADVFQASLTDPVPRYVENAAQPAFAITDHKTPLIAAVVNAADFAADAPLAPGSIAAIFGSNLSSQGTTSSTKSLPTTLGGTTVRINGTPAPIFAAMPGQVNIQIPWEVAGFGATSVQVTNDGLVSEPEEIKLSDVAPYLFVSAEGKGIVTREVPVKAGSLVTFYGTGLGPVHHQPPSGAPAHDSTSTTLNAVTVSVGGIPTIAVFAGLVPKVVGVYEVNIKIPEALAFGPSIPVKLTVAGEDSNTVFLDLP